MGSDSAAVLQVVVLVSDGYDGELPSPQKGLLLVLCAEQGCTCAGLKDLDLVGILACGCTFLVLVSDFHN